MKRRPGPRRTAQEPLPLVFVHTRITGVGVTLEATEALRNAILALVQEHADQWACRIRRRTVGPKEGLELWGRYASRAGVQSSNGPADQP